MSACGFGTSCRLVSYRRNTLLLDVAEERPASSDPPPVRLLNYELVDLAFGG